MKISGHDTTVRYIFIPRKRNKACPFGSGGETTTIVNAIETHN
jgi:hypothetical protein